MKLDEDITEVNLGSEVITERNSKSEDNISREMFSEPYLCAQFLRGYTDLPELKDVQPEDIEDMTERFLPLLTTERTADVIKKVHLKENGRFYFVSLIEHKTQVDFDVIMKLLRYMVYIWEDYELISLREYTNEELAQKGDEMSLIMLLNRIQSRMDLNQIGLWRENLGKVLERTPEHVVNLIVKQIAVLAGHLNLSVSQTEEIISSVKERDMPRMYEFFEDFDLPKAKEEMKAEHAAAMAKVAAAMEKVKEEAEKVKAEAEVEQERIAAEWERIAKERCELQRAREEVELLRENLRKATQEGLAN